jgi:hypothetical protein
MGNVGFRQFFKPVQPSVRLQKEVGYTEVLQETRLEPYIYCYWQLNSEVRSLAPFSYRVIPDGCVDIFFDVNDAQDSRIMGSAPHLRNLFLLILFITQEYDFYRAHFLSCLIWMRHR